MTGGVSGINVDAFNPEIGPREDLFMHVHGAWLEKTKIPSDKARWGSFDTLAERAEQDVKQIVTESETAEPGTEERKIGDLYASFMDEDAANAKGLDPIRAELSELDAVTSIREFLEFLGRHEATGGPGFIGQFVDGDFGDPDRYILFWSQAGIGLPDESYYREEAFEEIREEYKRYAQRMLGFLEDETTAAEQTAALWELEKNIAKVHWDAVASRDFEKMYNVRAVRDEYPVLEPWLDTMDAPSHIFDRVVVAQPSFVEGVVELLTADNLEAWKAWAKLSILRGAAPYLTSEMSRANFDFYGTVLTGTTKQRARWKRGVRFVEGAIGDAVGRAYVERHFPPTAKARMNELIENLVAAYEQSIKNLDWMSEETRQRALEKLGKFVPKIGYPVKWREYGELSVTDDLMQNARSASKHEHDFELAKVGGKLDRDEWEMSPQTVNAYYHPGRNEIVFPAAILQPPFFHENWDDAAIYGAIGAVIGHEIGHGFDDQGSKFDGDGQLLDWWTADDRSAFEERTSVLIDQFNELKPKDAPDHAVNGELTIGENIGDLGGLGIAWKAYQLSLGGGEAPVIDGLTGAQRFFYSWAAVWQMKIRPAEAVRLVQIDPHSPNEHRTNQIVKNLDAFYDAFGVQEGDPMYLAPEQRVTIW